MQETWVWPLGWENTLEKEMATHSSILAWRISWTEEPGGLQSMGSQRVRYYWATSLSFHFSLRNQTFNQNLKMPQKCPTEVRKWPKVCLSAELIHIIEPLSLLVAWWRWKGKAITFLHHIYAKSGSLLGCFSCVWPFVASSLLCPRDSPGKKTEVGFYFLLQIFPTQGSNPHLLCLLHCRQILNR